MIRKIIVGLFNSDKLAKKLLSPKDYAKHIGLKFGSNCIIATKNFSAEPFLITIGDNVRLARRVSFYTHGGMWIFRKEYPELDYFGKINIGNNCFIGEDAKIMPGVIIENNCIIGAGAVVTKSIPEGCIVAGNPARYIGTSSDFIEKAKALNCETKQLTKHDKINKLLSLSDDHFMKKGFIKTKEN